MGICLASQDLDMEWPLGENFGKFQLSCHRESTALPKTQDYRKNLFMWGG
jgi:hypothetical protein